jgi:hypothetical protein
VNCKAIELWSLIGLKEQSWIESRKCSKQPSTTGKECLGNMVQLFPSSFEICSTLMVGAFITVLTLLFLSLSKYQK